MARVVVRVSMGGVTVDPLRPLLDAALEGDDQALAELVRRTQPAVWRVCTTLGSRGEEEDLVQEVYLRALRAIQAYRGDAPVMVWLVSIARRACADHVRRREGQRRLLHRLKLMGPDQTVEIPGSIDDLVGSLDPDRRNAFVLTQLLGLSYEEAALALDCPIGTIRSRVARARRDLVTLVREAEAN